jgi:hypothetical protein
MSVEKRQSSPYSITGLNPYPWIRWWYALAAPPAPDQVENLPLKDREFLRRGKLTSIALLIMLTLLLTQLVPALHDGTQAYLLILINIASLVVSTVLNRFGKLQLAGWLTILTVDVGMFASMAFPSGGHLSIAPGLPFLFLLIQPLMLSVLLFPSCTWAILVVGGINVLLTGGVLLFVPKTHELQVYMQSPAVFVIAGVPIESLIIFALISFIVITSLQESLIRADKAEEITKLQQVMAEQTRQELQAKRQLEAGIQEIISGLTRFSNKDPQARIRLEQGHVLWPVASNINNMIGRFVRLREQERPMEQTVMAVQTYLTAIRMSKITGNSTPLPYTGTEVDTLVEELLTYSSPAQGQQQNSQYFQ